VCVLADAESVARTARDLVLACARAAAAARGRFTLLLSGGSTPRRLYELLAELPGDAAAGERGLPWSRTEIFFGDERCVAPDHPDSNYGMARAALLARAPIDLADPARVHPVRFESFDLAGAELAAERYEAEIARAFGAAAGAAPPRFDLALLGLGADGHTASLFPGTDALLETRRWVAATWVAKLGAPRVTVTFPLLAAARGVLFLVAGAEKAAAVAGILGPDAVPRRYPAQSVRPVKGRVAWLLDRAAAGGVAAPRGVR
jgi:6-phosphogluconolactonase